MGYCVLNCSALVDSRTRMPEYCKQSCGVSQRGSAVNGNHSGTELLVLHEQEVYCYQFVYTLYVLYLVMGSRLIPRLSKAPLLESTSGQESTTSIDSVFFFEDVRCVRVCFFTVYGSTPAAAGSRGHVHELKTEK